ncbi:hypothetical protein LCGC14_3040280, partial [marine sediment metagenome]
VITCGIPPNRADLTREADLIEEVARLAGYNNIPVSDEVTHALTAETRETRTRRAVGETMTAAGFDEAVTNTFIDAEEAKLFGWNKCVTVDPSNRRTNNALRPTVLPNLLRACKTNQDAGNRDVHLFELAGVFEPGDEGDLPAEHVVLGVVTFGELGCLRGALEALVERIAPTAKLEVRRADVAGFAEDAAAKILLDGERIGTLGMIGKQGRESLLCQAEELFVLPERVVGVEADRGQTCHLSLRHFGICAPGGAAGPFHLSVGAYIVPSSSTPPRLLRRRRLISDPHTMADKKRPGDGDVGVVLETRTKTQRPPLYKVMLLNDDYTPMEFVVHVLERFFGLTHAQSFEIMLTVHKKG